MQLGRFTCKRLESDEDDGDDDGDGDDDDYLLTSLFSGCVQQQQCFARAASDSRRHPGHCGQVCQVRLQVRSFGHTLVGFLL